MHRRCGPKEAEGGARGGRVNSLAKSSCFFSLWLHRGHFSAAATACQCVPRRSPSHAAAAISPQRSLPYLSGGAGMAKGTDKWNSVALQLIIMPRLSLTDSGDLSRSHADTYISSRCGEGHAWQHFPYPALAVDFDVLFTLASIQRCHQVYLRAIFPFSAFTFFSTSYFLLRPPTLSSLQFISEERL